MAIFYYPVKIYQGESAGELYAPFVSNFPLSQQATSSVLVLTSDEGARIQGMYVLDNNMWKYVIPYRDISESIIQGDEISVYFQLTDPVTLTEGQVYQNGIPIGSHELLPGPAIVYGVRKAVSSGGGGAVDSVNGKTGAVGITGTGGVLVNNSGANIQLSIDPTFNEGTYQ